MTRPEEIKSTIRDKYEDIVDSVVSIHIKLFNFV
jgi:hypothetical protein